jgi:hypothetical protein
LTVVVDQVQRATDAELSQIGGVPATLPEPGDAYCRLAQAGRAWVTSDGLDVFLVESLPGPLAGLSLGLPGPPDPSSYYFGAVVRVRPDDAGQARAIAHEVAHFLNLHHLQDVGVSSGMTYSDPLDDTHAGDPNLMDATGTVLTEGQAFSLSRSPLLRRR